MMNATRRSQLPKHDNEKLCSQCGLIKIFSSNNQKVCNRCREESITYRHLTPTQKQAGYFVTQKDDFVWLFHGQNTDKPRLVKCWLYQLVKIKEVRNVANEDNQLRCNVGQAPRPTVYHLSFPQKG